MAEVEGAEQPAALDTTKKEDPSLETIVGVVEHLRTAEGRRRFWKKGRTFVGIAIAAGVAVTLIEASAEIAAAGFHTAWMLYRQDWLLTLLGFVLGPSALWAVTVATSAVHFIVVLPFHLLGEALSKKVTRYLRFAFFALGAVLVALLIFKACFESAADKTKMPIEGDRNAGREIKAAVDSQRQATEQLSNSAAELLSQLDETSAQLVTSRNQLKATLEQADKQRAQVQKAQAEVDKLLEDEQVVQSRDAKLRELLNGEQPLTVHYFDRSGWETVIVSLVAGGVISHLAAIWKWLRALAGQVRAKPAA